MQTYLLAKLLAALLLDVLVQQAEEQNPELFQSLQRPVSVWRLEALLWWGIRDWIVGSFSLKKILTALPSLRRYLNSVADHKKNHLPELPQELKREIRKECRDKPTFSPH